MASLGGSQFFSTRFAGGALDELVRGQAGVAHFGGALAARHRQMARIQQTQLNQHGGLIPIDVLVRNLAFPESDDRHQRHLDPFARGRNAGQHPIHRHGVGELKDHFIHDLRLANGPGNRRGLRIRGHLGNEETGVEIPNGLQALSAGHRGHVINVPAFNHGRHRVIHALGCELALHVLLPDLLELLLRGREG